MIRTYIFVFCCCLSLCYALETDVSKYLEGRIPLKNARYKSFTMALELMKSRNVKTIVETGTSNGGIKNCQGAGCSTMIFAHWASENDALVYTVDIRAETLKGAEQDVGSTKDYVRFNLSDSVEFLRNFNQTIDFLYLDSLDYHSNNPSPSQTHHLKEIFAALPFLTEESIVMIDDCNLIGGGKGLLAIDYLVKNGWNVVYNGHQVILVRN